jgi:uncharacterized membrane protein YhhN
MNRKRFVFPVLAVFTLAGIFIAQELHASTWVHLLKPTTSILFVLAAWSGGLHEKFAKLIFTGLIFGLLGDTILMFGTQVSFILGIGAFLLGHVLYTVAFTRISSIRSLKWRSGIWIVLASAGAFFWLRPKLGAMQIPVAAYVVVISLMVWSAWAAASSSSIPEKMRRLIAVGATLFYLSDFIVAKNSFIGGGFFSNAFALAIYYIGQFMIAFSGSEWPKDSAFADKQGQPL